MTGSDVGAASPMSGEAIKRPYGSKVAGKLNDFVMRYGREDIQPLPHRHLITLLVRDRWDGPHAKQSYWEEYAEFWYPDAVKNKDEMLLDACNLAQILATMSTQQLKKLAISYSYMPWVVGGEQHG